MAGPGTIRSRKTPQTSTVIHVVSKGYGTSKFWVDWWCKLEALVVDQILVICNDNHPNTNCAIIARKRSAMDPSLPTYCIRFPGNPSYLRSNATAVGQGLHQFFANTTVATNFTHEWILKDA